VIVDPLIYIRPLRTAALPETGARRCPDCKTDQLTPVGRVAAGGGTIKEEVRCETCETVFVFVKPSLT
jgi:hypothetical protein